MPASTDTAAYFAIAAASPVLDREEELILTRAYATRRCPLALDRLVRSMMRFIVHTAARYVRSGVAMADLIAEGSLGVIKAAARFEPERGLRFVTFAAHWVRAEMGAAVTRQRSHVVAALPRPATRTRLRRAQARAYAVYGSGEAGNERLAETLGLSRPELDGLLARIDLREVSLDDSIDGDSAPMRERLAADGPTPEDAVARTRWERDLPRAVARAVATLDRRERFIARARLMANPDEELTLAEVGRRLKVTRERARQLELRTKDKLRRHLASVRPLVALAA